MMALTSNLHGPQRYGVALLCTVVFLAGCGKVADKVSEKATEKVVESAMSADGVKAKVSISGKDATVTTTDDKGQKVVTELGRANITEADLGVSLYPGARLRPDSAIRTSATDGAMVSATYDTLDSTEKVAAFYRAQLRDKSAGKHFVDIPDAHSATFMLIDGATQDSLTLVVKQETKGSSIEIARTSMASK